MDSLDCKQQLLRCGYACLTPGRTYPHSCVMSTCSGSNHPENRYNPQNQPQPPQHSSSPSRYKSPSLSAAPAHHTHSYSPEQLGIPINYQDHPYHHYSGHGGTAETFGASEKDSAVYLSVDPTSIQELGFRLMNIDPNVSPSSGITSVRDYSGS